MGHGERGAGQQGRIAPAAHDARDLEQFFSVVRSPRAAGEYQIVTRSFAFGPDVTRGNPGKRIEPVQGARELRDDVRQAIAAFHVRELVQEDDPQPFERPSIRIFRHQHGRREDSRRHRHRGARTFVKGQTPRDVELGGELHGERQPRRVDHSHGPTRQPLDGDEPHHQTSYDRAHAGRPDKHQRHRQRDARHRALCGLRRSGRLRLDRRGRGRRRSDAGCPRAAGERRCCGNSIVGRRQRGVARQRDDRQLPSRERDREDRKHERARERHGPHQMADRGRRAAEHERREAREAEDERDFDEGVDGRQPEPVEAVQECRELCGNIHG